MALLKLIVISLCVMSLGSSHAQISFQKTYGSSGFEKASRVIQTFDNSYVVVGSSGLTGGSSDVYILKVDSLGNYLWSKFYGTNNVDHGTDIVQTLDSGYAISGYTNGAGFGGYDAYLIKLDKDGNLEWETTFGGSDWDFAHAIQQRSDSGYVLVGETYSFGEGNNDVYVIRTDKNGSVIWEQTIGTPGNDVGKDFILTTFQSTIITGTTNGKGAGGDDVYAIRLNPAGDTVWTKTYGSALNESASAIKTLTQFNYYNMAVTKESGTYGTDNMYLIGINGNGDTMYTREYDLPENVRATDLAYRYPVDLMMSATIEDPATGDNYLGYYMNYFGTPLQSFSYGTFGVEECNSVIHAYDDGFLLAGITEGYAYGGTDIFLVKIGPSPTFQTGTTIDGMYVDFTPVKEEVQQIISIYPNPCSDQINIEFESGSMDLKIYDLTGKLIESRHIFSGTQQLNDLSSGMYIFELIDEDGRAEKHQVLIR